MNDKVTIVVKRRASKKVLVVPGAGLEELRCSAGLGYMAWIKNTNIIEHGRDLGEAKCAITRRASDLGLEIGRVENWRGELVT
jgi:hypothetical protein